MLEYLNEIVPLSKGENEYLIGHCTPDRWAAIYRSRILEIILNNEKAHWSYNYYVQLFIYFENLAGEFK